MTADPIAENPKIVARRRGDPAHIDLKNTTRGRCPIPTGVRTVQLREIATGVQRSVIYCLKDGDIEAPRGVGGKREMEHHEDVGKTLNTDAQRSSATCGSRDSSRRVVRDVDTSVGVENNSLHNAE